jgi:hypothetical protein
MPAQQNQWAYCNPDLLWGQWHLCLSQSIPPDHLPDACALAGTCVNKSRMITGSTRLLKQGCQGLNLPVCQSLAPSWQCLHRFLISVGYQLSWKSICYLYMWNMKEYVACVAVVLYSFLPPNIVNAICDGDRMTIIPKLIGHDAILLSLQHAGVGREKLISIYCT